MAPEPSAEARAGVPKYEAVMCLTEKTAGSGALCSGGSCSAVG